MLTGCSSTLPKEKESSGQALEFTVSNPLDEPVDDALVTIRNWQKYTGDKAGLTSGFLKATASDKDLAIQASDLDNDGLNERIDLVISLGANENLNINVSSVKEAERKGYPKRAHAEISVKQGGTWKDRVYHGGEFTMVNHLAVPPEHTDHSFFIRYEGPGWESEKVGYRFYLDWRNATDIFGKKSDQLVLDQVGLDGFDSYHEMAGWGMDILKVGEALGLGALGCWSDNRVLRMSQTDSVSCTILRDGPVVATVGTNYYGWSTPYGKTNVGSRLSISAGSRLTKHAVKLSQAVDSLCTGIVKHENAELIQSVEPEGWCYLATWGQQSLAGDNLGMAIFFRSEDHESLTGDNFNHVVRFNSNRNELEYYFAACWEQEENGIKTMEEFVDFLEFTRRTLNNPVEWKLNEQ